MSGDEAAPVPTVVTGLRSDTIDVAALVDRVRRDDCGGLVVFEGTTRTPNHGHDVLALDYEAWEDRTPTQLERIATEVAHAHGLAPRSACTGPGACPWAARRWSSSRSPRTRRCLRRGEGVDRPHQGRGLDLEEGAPGRRRGLDRGLLTGQHVRCSAVSTCSVSGLRPRRPADRHARPCVTADRRQLGIGAVAEHHVALERGPRQVGHAVLVPARGVDVDIGGLGQGDLRRQDRVAPTRGRCLGLVDLEVDVGPPSVVAAREDAGEPQGPVITSRCCPRRAGSSGR